ncbi:MAG: hypothetical protein LBQ69_05170 [Treponema sp.]|jgi:hypothetical protein|nr:hypothetical protein [Treponema sp.]
MKRTKLVYLLGRNEKELLAYDEYDSEGSGKWFTDNPIMANEYNFEQAVYEGAAKEGLDVYMWEVTYDTNERKIIKEEIWLQFTIDEAIKWKKDHAK